jgi:hypothetical protein
MPETPKNHHEGLRILFAGLAAAGFACIVQMLQLQSLSNSLITGLYCLASSIPFLILCYNVTILSPKLMDTSTLFRSLGFLGIIVSFVGLCLVMFHLSSIAGLIFLVSAVICIIIELSRTE